MHMRSLPSNQAVDFIMSVLTVEFVVNWKIFIFD